MRELPSCAMTMVKWLMTKPSPPQVLRRPQGIPNPHKIEIDLSHSALRRYGDHRELSFESILFCAVLKQLCGAT